MGGGTQKEQSLLGGKYAFKKRGAQQAARASGAIGTRGMAVPGRLELPTFGLGNRCSIRLSYGTKLLITLVNMVLAIS